MESSDTPSPYLGSQLAESEAVVVSTSSPEVHFLPAQSLRLQPLHIRFAPQASDSSFLLGSKMHCDVKFWSLQVITEASSKSVLLLDAVAFILYC